MVKILTAENQTNCIKMLVYGASGVGKTVFGASAPSPIFLNAEGGMLSVADRNIDRINIETFQDLRDAFDFLKAGQHKYQTVIIDSLTEIQKKSMDGILAKSGNEKPLIGDWGTNIEEVRKISRYFRDLQMNVILIALEQIEKDEISGQTMRAPALQGKSLPQEVMGFYDIVGHMSVQEKNLGMDGGPAVIGKPQQTVLVRSIRVQPSQSVYAKDRSSKLGASVEPDFTKIFNTVFSGSATTPTNTAKEEQKTTKVGKKFGAAA
jgi:hypothetical protein